ncbi:MAG: amidohydrolase family protein, partial [Deltaproteobacteria bacterium]|nr:amidohydrolase family protein [Deltaproteobacteria bacterium]
CYGTFPKRYRECVINRKEMSVAAAIRTMTSLPAEKFNMKERGKIAKGYYADIAVINLNTFRALSTYKNPSQYSEGIQHLFVNGTQSIENGEATHKRGGRGLIMA